VSRTPPIQRPQTPVTGSKSAVGNLAPQRTDENIAGVAAGSPGDKRELSMVEEVQRELEEETHLSPIQVARTSIPPPNEDGMMDLEKENGTGGANEEANEVKPPAVPTPRANDAYMRVWNTALANRPTGWQAALSRVAGGNGLDMFQFGSKTIQCRLIGSDMLIIDGKTQTLVDRFLDQYGETLSASQQAAASSSSNSQDVNEGGAVSNSQGFSQQTTGGEPAKKGGLRFKNLRKQPLGNTNDMETN